VDFCTLNKFLPFKNSLHDLIFTLLLQACIKPVESSSSTKKAKDVTDEASVAGDDRIKINKSKGWKAKRVQKAEQEPEVPKTKTPLNVTLGDCLACSGCITSAEAVLIAEQSHEKVFEVLEKKDKVCLMYIFL